MREISVEKYLIDQVKRKLDGETRKWATRKNDPDRIIILPERFVAFVELKRPGKRPTQGQFRELERLRELGYIAEWANSFESVDLIINKIRETRGVSNI